MRFAQIVALVGFFKLTNEQRSVDQVMVAKVVVDIAEIAGLHSYAGCVDCNNVRPGFSFLPLPNQVYKACGTYIPTPFFQVTLGAGKPSQEQCRMAL